jgi:putative tryptophan/tyrosine transport system substrate-binding protein
MHRRAFLAALGGAAALPFIARAQQQKPRIGLLTVGAVSSVLDQAVLQGLKELGYIDGQNLVIEVRAAAGEPGRVAGFAAELVAAKVDLIIAAGSQATTAAQRATSAIPIVFTSTNPVGLGFVSSLARPGGNLTGVSLLGPEVSGKRLELLKELLPEIAKVAVLWDSHDPAAKFSLEETQALASGLKLKAVALDVHAVADLDGAFVAAGGQGCSAAILLPAPLFSRNAPQVAELGIKHRMPTLFWSNDMVRAGGLIGYGPNLIVLYRRTAYYVDRILKGQRPADLPVEQPTKFELTINLKTAKALGVNIPPTLLARADEVIE